MGIIKEQNKKIPCSSKLRVEKEHNQMLREEIEELKRLKLYNANYNVISIQLFAKSIEDAKALLVNNIENLVIDKKGDVVFDLGGNKIGAVNIREIQYKRGIIQLFLR